MKTVHVAILCSLLMPLAASAQTVAPPPAEATVNLEKYLVVGQPIESYRATDALTGTKTGAALRDVPFVLTVVPRQLVEDRRFTFLGEALDNVAGAQRKMGYGGVQNFGAFIRGFDSGFVTLRNGFRDFGFYTLRDTANVERYEILKGPASLLYGNLQPGGITNTLSKQPLATPFRQATVIAGDFDFYRGELDLGGPLSDKVFYRLNLAAEDAGSFRDHVGSRSEFIAPVVTWFVSEKTRLTVEFEYKHADYTWDLGLPRNPLSFTVPISRFLGEPDGKNNVQSAFASSLLEHQLNANWKFRQNLSAAYSGGDYNLRSPLSIGADGRTVSRVAYATDEHSENYAVQHELVGQFDLGATRHQAIVGVDLNRALDNYTFIFSSLASIDLLAPVYGAQPAAGFPLFANDNQRDDVGVYFQDLVTVRENFKVLFGARYDSVHYESVDLLSNAVARKATDTALTPQVGMVYQPSAASSLYASYSTSFLPIPSGRKADGTFLVPEEGEQFEVGAKHEFLDGKASATLAAFWITKQNVSTPDPVTPTFRVQTGEQKSRGVEVEFTGQVLPGWDVIASGAYIDAYVSRDNTFPVGSLLPGAPEWSGSLWQKYTVQSGSAKGLALGVGAFSAAKRKAGLPNAAWWLPSYTRFDAMVGYGRDAWHVQLNVKNVTDERIYDLTGTTMMPQAPRTFLVSGTYTF
ncbi:MAG TPA: TonB-dependent siderophore receptor [Lacunisphaera sp.]|nr:TonB-dependent siderophore receptor [Lacunisphaera sp.]